MVKIIEANMKTKYHFWLLILFIFFTCFTYQMSGQPYYYYHGDQQNSTDVVISPNFWRVNLQTGAKDLFYSDSAFMYGWLQNNPSQEWMFITIANDAEHQDPDDYYISTGIVNASTWNFVQVFPIQNSHAPGYNS